MRIILVSYCGYGLSGSSAGKESTCHARRPQFHFWVRKICWRREWLPTPVLMGFPGGSAGKESAHSAGDLGWIPRLERSPGEGSDSPLQYSCLEKSMDIGGWWATPRGCKDLDMTGRLSLSLFSKLPEI